MIKCLAITGPTAAGKTALSIALAKEISAEIISCDSMQIYKGMDIGTAKVTDEETKGIKHHLIDIRLPKEQYSTEEYRKDATLVAKDISARGKIPLFVGGTGLYIDTLVRACSNEVAASDPAFRDKMLESIKSERDVDALWNRLSEVDPVSAEKIHKNNVRRVIRALEIYETTGKPKSYFDELSKKTASDISLGMITLDFHNRENLYKRVNDRVDLMIEQGLLSEVQNLYFSGQLVPGTTASQAIGYKEIVEYIEGKCELSEAIENLKISSRRYAKRQLTWFRHELDVERIYLDSEDGALLDFDELTSKVLCAAKKLIKNIKGKNQ